MRRLLYFLDDHLAATSVFLLLAILSAAAFASWRLDIASCGRQADRLGTEWLHDAWGEGCFLQMDDGRFVPADRYRTVIEDDR